MANNDAPAWTIGLSSASGFYSGNYATMSVDYGTPLTWNGQPVYYAHPATGYVTIAPQWRVLPELIEETVAEPEPAAPKPRRSFALRGLD